MLGTKCLHRTHPAHPGRRTRGRQGWGTAAAAPCRPGTGLCRDGGRGREAQAHCSGAVQQLWSAAILRPHLNSAATNLICDCPLCQVAQPAAAHPWLPRRAAWRPCRPHPPPAAPCAWLPPPRRPRQQQGRRCPCWTQMVLGRMARQLLHWQRLLPLLQAELACRRRLLPRV